MHHDAFNHGYKAAKPSFDITTHSILRHACYKRLKAHAINNINSLLSYIFRKFKTHKDGARTKT